MSKEILNLILIVVIIGSMFGMIWGVLVKSQSRQNKDIYFGWIIAGAFLIVAIVCTKLLLTK